MKTTMTALATGLILAGCASTNLTTAVPAGFADGTKTTSTPDIIFTATSKGIGIDGAGNISLADVPIFYRTTADPDLIVAIVNGEEIELSLSVDGTAYVGENSNYFVYAELIGLSSSNQVAMTLFIQEAVASGPGIGGYAVVGLETDPTSIATMTGTASYTGGAEIIVLHEDGLGGANASVGSGSGTLSANFGTGVVSGSLSLTDAGTSDAGFEISPTSITIDPATISGNGFTSTLTITAADLAMMSIGSTAIDGKFFGVDASDVGATFSGSGLSAVGGSSAYFFGGFIGE